MSTSVVPNRSARKLWRLGITCLIGSVVVALTTMSWNDVWVIGSWVPRRRSAVGALTGVGLLFLLASVRKGTALTRRGTPLHGKQLARVLAVRSLTTAALLVSLPLTLFVFWLDGWSALRVLNPESAGGCRIVSRESDSFDSTRSITVYVVPASKHAARQVDNFGGDSNVIGMEEGQVVWRGEKAYLQLPSKTLGPWSC